ncbi:DUF2293 domain-containing protein [Magnetospirillum moscoviense]|uniref:DUF2293 domain-containing protein n=1 Tax=Magnetospirillum moscoviense TaxID=1437059 RepID=A0A178MQZ0_9PROT|nr:DUF2293 domain-containing protein [Magnetospirillum moscoviense]OAN51387.1 hypothetical protein A6A05_11005 [Magnetospirillum moscoviense]
MTAGRDRIAGALDRLARHVPAFERMAILDHAMDSPGLSKASPEAAAWLSMVATIRHLHTDYDGLLADFYDPDAARWAVAPAIDDILAAWGCRRRVSDDQR